MAASQSKPASRWGSFLQQAVAGVESRLDTILADEDNAAASVSEHKEPTAHQSEKVSADNEAPSVAVDRIGKGELSRQASRSRKHDRLQERLAKAVVSRNASRSGQSPTRSRNNNETALNLPVASRLSLDASSEEYDSEVDAQGLRKVPVFPDSPNIDKSEHEAVAATASSTSTTSTSTTTIDAASGSLPLPPSVDDSEIAADTRTSPSQPFSAQNRPARKSLDDVEDSNPPKEENTQKLLEYIESLQAKLKFLTDELLRKAQGESVDDAAGGNGKKLAQKDEKIALLLQEGQKLSQNELKLSNSIKKLRTKSIADESRLAHVISVNENLENANKSLSLDLKQLGTSQVEDRRHAASLEKELARLRDDNHTKSTTLRLLEKQLSEDGTGEDRVVNDIVQKDLDVARTTIASLKEELSTAQVEKKLALDRHRLQLREAQDRLDTEKERARAADIELRGEIRGLEGRLETYRARVEESSSGGGGDVQTKLFRQIETLQNQYNVASENWRGIEGTLLGRIANLEKDRDDLSKKEVDLRRKAREANNRYRRLEEDLDQAKTTIHSEHAELEHRSAKITSLEDMLTNVEAANLATNNELRSTQEELRSLRGRIDKQDIVTHEEGYNRVQSPPFAIGKPSIERYVPEKGTNVSRKQLATSGLGLSGVAGNSERPMSRRASAQSPFLVHRHDSFVSLQQGSSRGSVHSPSQTPSVQAEHQDDMFDGVVTPATPERTINDMFSASTAAAGPSVQLVERMSAAVRRLESEKAISKDEMERILAQRNEAREQVVSLMKETADKRTAEARIAMLEAEVGSINQRYQTTLEMLGEKSERVEELKADIADMKQIYKDVLERTIG